MDTGPALGLIYVDDLHRLAHATVVQLAATAQDPDAGPARIELAYWQAVSRMAAGRATHGDTFDDFPGLGLAWEMALADHRVGAIEQSAVQSGELAPA